MEKQNPSVEIMFYVMINGTLRAILNSYGQISRDNIRKSDPREGVCRPTICCGRIELNFVSLLEHSTRELGNSVHTDLVQVIQGRVSVKHPSKICFAALVPLEVVEKFCTPIYSGGLRFVSREHVADVVDIKPCGKRISSNGIPIIQGGHEFLKAGFEALSQLV